MDNDIYYIYFHVEPETEELVYIGKGSRGRAWHCAESNSRGEEHAAWMNELLHQGFTPDAWVRIIESSLSEKDALQKELELINKLKPKFNSKRDHSCKLSQQDILDAFTLRELGKTYTEISEILGYSTMTFYRALNGKTKNYVV